MNRLIAVVPFVLVLAAGCARTIYPETLACDHAIANAEFAKLRLGGPVRFAQVDDRLFRGGQPSTTHLAELKAMGVETIVSLRDEDASTTRDEAAAAEKLGMRFLHFPFSALQPVTPQFVDRVMSALADPHNGVIYVHCLAGKDRTSLMVALHLVRHRGWDSARAWQRAALDYGHHPTWWFRNLRRAFEREGSPS